MLYSLSFPVQTFRQCRHMYMYEPLSGSRLLPKELVIITIITQHIVYCMAYISATCVYIIYIVQWNPSILDSLQGYSFKCPD